VAARTAERTTARSGFARPDVSTDDLTGVLAGAKEDGFDTDGYGEMLYIVPGLSGN